VKTTPGWLACLILACAVAGCSGGDGGHRVYASALDGALAYLRDDTTAAFAIATDLDSEAPSRISELGPGGRRAVGAVARSQLGQPSIPFDAVIRPQIGNPLVVGITRQGDRVSAIRLKNPARMRRNLEQILGRGTVARLDSYEGAIVWKDSRATRTAKFGALADRELVVAGSERDLHEAIDAARGSENLASNRAVRVKLSASGLVNGVGDVQRLLDTGDQEQAADARRVRWIRSLGIFDLHTNVKRKQLFLEFRLSTRRVALSERDLPLIPGRASPRLHDPDAAASVAVLEPQQLVRFLEKVLRATDPTRFQRYETGIEQLRAILRIDLRRDLVDKIKSLSVAARSATSFTFVAGLAPGSAAAFRKDLDRAQLFVQGVIGDSIPNTSVTSRGFGAQRVWVVKNGNLPVARYAVRGGALIGTVGSGPLPRPSPGRRLRGVTGSLVIRGDLGRIGRLLDFVFQVPNDVFGVVSELGDLTFGVRTDTQALRGSGRIRVP
jgi:hypothetical protein